MMKLPYYYTVRVSLVGMLPWLSSAFLMKNFCKTRLVHVRPLFVSIPEKTISDSSLLLYGGDYAGLSATFDASNNGSILAIPAYLVPKDLVEWGQVPSFLETLTSEELLQQEHNNNNKYVLSRQTVKVLPAVGCGVDNLETTQSVETEELWHEKDSPDNNNNRGQITFCDKHVVALEYPLPPNHVLWKKRVETTFGLDDDDDENKRIRILLDVEFSKDKEDSNNRLLSILTPITMVLERKTSSTSTKGTIADGGGLDGRTVSRLIGSDLKKDPFPLFSSKENAGKENHNKDDKILSLPGNVTVIVHASPPAAWRLTVVHNNDENSQRRVVSRCYDLNGMLQEDGISYQKIETEKDS